MLPSSSQRFVLGTGWHCLALLYLQCGERRDGGVPRPTRHDKTGHDTTGHDKAAAFDARERVTNTPLAAFT